MSDASAVSAVYGPSGYSSTPAGIETNERSSGVRPGGVPDHAGGEGDERAQRRRRAANQHEGGAVALDPPLGARDPLRSEVQPAPVALDERGAAGAPERPPAERAGEVAERPGG